VTTIKMDLGGEGSLITLFLGNFLRGEKTSASLKKRVENTTVTGFPGTQLGSAPISGPSQGGIASDQKKALPGTKKIPGGGKETGLRLTSEHPSGEPVNKKAAGAPLEKFGTAKKKKTCVPGAYVTA